MLIDVAVCCSVLQCVAVMINGGHLHKVRFVLCVCVCVCIYLHKVRFVFTLLPELFLSFFPPSLAGVDVHHIGGGHIVKVWPVSFLLISQR